MYCPECKRDTNHADLGDDQYECVHCTLVHPKTVLPYFDHKLAAAGEKRYEPEA